MSSTEWIIIVTPLAYAILVVIVERFRRLKSSLDAAIVGLIFSLIFSLYYEKIPEMKNASGMMYSITKDSMVYPTFERASQVSRNLSEISDNTIHNIFRSYFDRQVRGFAGTLQDLANEKAVISKEDAVAFGTTAFDAALRTVDVTSYVEPRSWWLNSVGRVSRGATDYIAMNGEAVKRGVKIRRVFIFKNEDEYKKMETVLTENKKVGIEVSFVYEDQLSGSAKGDMLLVDKKLAGELMLDPDTRRYDRFEATYSKDQVETIAQRINIVIRNSEKF